MKIKASHVIAASVFAVLAGCSSGDLNLGVETTDNSVSNGGGNGGGTGGANPCASYTTSTNEVRQGAYDGRHCTYNSAFVGASNPLLQDVTIPFLSNSGVHVFEDSLFVGQNVSSGAAPAGGTGPKLTIAAGATLALQDASEYVLINRGSQIIAQGTAARPITFTGYTDAVLNTAGPEDVQLWGGLVINGNGVTNNCTDAQRAATQCHVVSEGAESHYGGADNAESSGILRYVVVKHTGFQVAPDDELNGLTLNAVGSGTTIENLEVYSTYDDGVEFFGGAANIRNLVALYVRDDSIDFSDGWSGTIENALVIHARGNSNWCVEGDNVGSTRTANQVPADTLPISNPTLRNLTCITSQSAAAPAGTGTHGDSRGIIVRQGARAQIVDSIVFGAYGEIANPATAASNTRCLEFNGTVSIAAAQAAGSSVNGTIFGCRQPTSGTINDAWVLAAPNAGNVIVNTPSTATVRLLEANSFYTATALTDAAGAPIASLPAPRRYGAVARSTDWTAGWTYGLHATNRGQPLWFE
jgi:hypothetical protein